MILQQPKIHVGLRIVAAGCIVLWLLASSFCSVEHLFDNDHHHAEAATSETAAHHDSDHSQEAEVVEHAHGEANHPHDSAQHSHDSHPHDDGEDACCSTLMATAQFTTPFVIIKPILQPLDFLCPVSQARDLMLSASKDELERQVKPPDWVFTPQVCLGAAHRGLAPPSLA
jgi:hypothetical protein